MPAGTASGWVECVSKVHMQQGRACELPAAVGTVGTAEVVVRRKRVGRSYNPIVSHRTTNEARPDAATHAC